MHTCVCVCVCVVAVSFGSPLGKRPSAFIINMLTGIAFCLGAMVVRNDTVLGDDCGHVYLDVGSNIGVQVRKLFEPLKYPGAPVLSMFSKHFGSSTLIRNHVCAFGFEANPAHAPRLAKVQQCYQSKGWRTNFIVPRVVSTIDGRAIEFITTNQSKNTDGGASILRHKWGPGGTRVNRVTSLDFPAWLERHIFSRRLPKGFGYGDNMTRPVVLMKMDIEGAEYRLLPQLLSHGALCRNKIDYMYSEEHGRWEHLVPAEHKMKNSALMTVNAALRLSARTCTPTQNIAMDDETYTHDHLDDDNGWRSDDPSIYNDDLCDDGNNHRVRNFTCTKSWWCSHIRRNRQTRQRMAVG